MMSFGSTIKQLRKKKGYTQDQLANLLNVTPQAISRWENNSAMPDISLLIPIANVFSVSIDTLLGVDVEKNAQHIRDFCENVLTFELPYGETADEKHAIYRDEIRKYPDSVELREALFNILARQSTVSGKFKDAALLREMASLAEDIIEMGGGAEGRDHYQAMLAFFNQELHNPERAKAIVDNATEMMFSKEVLLPTALVGRKRVEAQKKLIYMCADLIRRTVFDMYDQQEVDDVERLALLPAEKIMECLYGESFARHFEHVTTMYIGVKAAIARGDQKDAILRLKDLVQRLEQKEEESAVITPLVPEYEVELYYTSSLALLNVRNQAKVLLGNVETDFQKNDVNEDTVNDIKHRLERLSQSSGGQLKEDCITFIVNMMKQQREGTYTGELLEEMKN